MTTRTEAAAIVNDAVAPVARRFNRYVDRADLTQQCQLWVVQHQELACKLLTQSRTYLVRRLRTVAERYARREKANRLGYHPDDEEYYSLPRLAALLPDALDEEALPPQAGMSDQIAGRQRTYSDWEASVSDVRSALKQIPLPDYAVLAAEFGSGGGEYTELEVSSALRAVQRVLGGPRPLPEEEIHDGTQFPEAG